MIGFTMQVHCRNMISFGQQSIEEQHSQRVIKIVESHCFESFNISVETTHFCTGMLRSAEVELDHGPEVSENSGDSGCTEGISQGSPGSALVSATRLRILCERHNSMLPFAMLLDRVQAARAWGLVGAVVVPLTINQSPVLQRYACIWAAHSL